MKKRKEEELFIPKERHFVKILIFLLILIMIGGAGFYYYKNYYENPKFIISKIVDEVEKRTLERQNKKDDNQNFKINALINLNLDLGNDLKNLTDILNDISFQINSEYDNKNNKSIIDINTKYKNDKLINIQSYNDNLNTYIYLEDIFDKYLQLDTFTVIKDINTSDIYQIENTLIKVLKDKINNLNYQRQEEEITINNKKYDVYNNYIEFKDNELTDFLSSIIDTLIKDEKFLNSLDNLIDIEYDEMSEEKMNAKSSLEELQKELKEDPFKGIYKLSFYTTKSFKQELIYIKQEIVNETQKNTLTINLTKENYININIQEDDMLLELNFFLQDSKFNLDTKIQIDDIILKLSGNFNYEKIDTIRNIDTHNSIKLDELSDEDSITITENLANNETLQSLINELTNVIYKQYEV